MNKADRRRLLTYAGFAVLVALYIAAAVFMPIVSRSQAVIAIGDSRLPVSALTGVLSSLANICLICLTVFHGKMGLITALVLLLSQLPILVRNMIVNHNLVSIPGTFSMLLTLVAIIVIRSRDKRIESFRQDELSQLAYQQKQAERLFEQTAAALVTAIDAKDEYSRGHSMRVADYSRRLAEMMGKSEEECRKVYYAGMLHDAGKLGITDAIISKNDALTPEEYEEVKKHTVLGEQILSTIRDHPYIGIGAHYHHERYDGKGYPEGLKGDDIPEIARIISVADAYDVMSSSRSYRKAIPQQIIREEIIAGAGSQFDPDIAMIMRHLIDQDTEYRMKEISAAREMRRNSGLQCGEYRSEVSDGILIRPEITRIRLEYRDDGSGNSPAVPTVILFDALDGRVHSEPQEIRNLDYFEYAEIRLDGETVNHGVRAIRTEMGKAAPAAAKETEDAVYEIEAVRCRDHALLAIRYGRKTVDVTVALPDSSRFAYIGLTGSHCVISGIHADRTGEKVKEDYIPRIAEEISYIDGPEGDVPNVQVDSIRSGSSAGIPVADSMRLTFHTMSLPTARLIWHCPYIVLFRSEDGKVNGKGYREYAVVRLDGENWDNDSGMKSRIIVNQEEDFGGWEAWKEGNKAGYDCTVKFTREGNRITVSTLNLGLSVKGILTLPETAAKETVYAALTGDQVALTNIRAAKE